MCRAGTVSEEPGSPLVCYLEEGIKNYVSMEDAPKWGGRRF